MKDLLFGALVGVFAGYFYYHGAIKHPLYPATLRPAKSSASSVPDANQTISQPEKRSGVTVMRVGAIKNPSRRGNNAVSNLLAQRCELLTGLDYYPLFERLNLTMPIRAKLTALIVNQRQLAAEISDMLASGALLSTDEAQNAYRSLKTQSETEVQDLLGTNYSAYASYAVAQPIKAFGEQIQPSLIAVGCSKVECDLTTELLISEHKESFVSDLFDPYTLPRKPSDQLDLYQKRMIQLDSLGKSLIGSGVSDELGAKIMTVLVSNYVSEMYSFAINRSINGEERLTR
jgi:hypothetical protein